MTFFALILILIHYGLKFSKGVSKVVIILITIVFSPLYVPFVLFGHYFGGFNSYFIIKFLSTRGLIFVKLFQILSTRKDLFNEKEINLLRSFQSSTKPMNDESLDKILKRNVKIFNSLVDFNKNPIHSASIAQLHIAYLNGEKVAVKIKKINTERDAKRSLLFLQRIKKILNLLCFYKINSVIDEVAELINQEVDFFSEVRNIKDFKFSENYNIVKVNIFDDLCNHEIITMKYLEGFTLKEIILNHNDFLSVEERVVLLKKLCHSFLSQVYESGIFHADLHHSNIIVSRNKYNKILIAFVDFGCVGRLSDKDRVYLGEIFHYFTTRNYRKVAISHIEAGYVPSDVDVDSFSKQCELIGERYINNTKKANISELLMDVIIMAKKFRMSPQPQLITLQKTMVMFEGIVNDVSGSGFNIYDYARKWLIYWYIRNKFYDSKILKLLNTVKENFFNRRF